jgi:molybdopterin/thiamine biosynthesis adenylyltransferase
MYSRNELYISAEEQQKIRVCRLLLAGTGLGSNIAECALRLGFENIHLIDGDVIEKSNLNRQNYTFADIGKNKAEILCERLLSINPRANIKYDIVFLEENNLNHFLKDVDIAINTMDFTSDAPFAFDDYFVKQGIPVLHPYNLGWAGFVCVVNNCRLSVRTLKKDSLPTELEMGKYIDGDLTFWGKDEEWFTGLVEKVSSRVKAGIKTMPQLAISSWLTAGLSAQILFRLATGKTVKFFPKYYFLSIGD